MDGERKINHLILVKPKGKKAQQQGTFIKTSNSNPCKQKFQLPYNSKLDTEYKTRVGLNKERKQGGDGLCDVALAIDDKRIYAHKRVLVEHSEYFRAMFTSGMMESRKAEIEMHDTTHTALSAALDFIYTGSFVIWPEDLKDVLATACMLQLDSLIDLCSSEITNYLDVSNCLGMYTFGEMYSLDKLRDDSEDLIKWCFHAVTKENEFVEIDAKVLATIVGWDGLNLGPNGCEDDVMKAVLKWYRHNPEERAQGVAMVMENIKLSQLSPTMQSQLKTDESFAHNKDITALLNNTSPPQEHRQFSHLIYAIGGYRQSRTGDKSPQAKSIEIFNTDTKKWLFSASYHLPRTLSAETTLTMDGKLFLGKCTKNEHSKESWEVCSFNPVTNVWKVEQELHPWTKWLTYYPSGDCLKNFVKAIDEANGLMYFCGSLLQRDGAPARTVYRYDVKSVKLKELPSLPETRFHHGAIVLNGRLYIIGGNDWESSIKDTVYMYDPEEEKWVLKQPMNVARAGVGLVVLDGFIYAVGGTNTTARQRSAECYDPDLDQWTAIADMHVPRAFHGMVVAGNKIYAFGGKSMSGLARSVTNSLEVYDPTSMQWEIGDKMQEMRCLFNASCP